MKITRLGSLHADTDIPEWLVSKPVAVPYFDGLELKFTLCGLKDTDELDANAAIESFLKLSSSDRLSASPHVFKNYREMADAVGEEDLGCTIKSERSIWKHVHPSEIYVKRRRRRDKSI